MIQYSQGESSSSSKGNGSYDRIYKVVLHLIRLCASLDLRQSARYLRQVSAGLRQFGILWGRFLGTDGSRESSLSIARVPYAVGSSSSVISHERDPIPFIWSPRTKNTISALGSTIDSIRLIAEQVFSCDLCEALSKRVSKVLF
jgi:hypothetical protein